QWEEGFEHLQAYVKEYKHCRVPAQYKTPDGYPLGNWVVFQRVPRNKLSSERKARLDVLGFDWAPHDTAWEDGLEHFRAFVTEHQHCRVPSEYKSPDGYKLGRWVIGRRNKKDTLSAERVAILDALGFDWVPITTQWEEGFEHLQAYVKEYKDCRVSTQYKSSDGYRLGQWISEQRHNRDTLSPERKARLDALGFVWDEREAGWEEGFSYLKAYKEREGHCRVPAKYKTPDGYRLGPWVSV